jgi:hypothetical protein
MGPSVSWDEYRIDVLALAPNGQLYLSTFREQQF